MSKLPDTVSDMMVHVNKMHAEASRVMSDRTTTHGVPELTYKRAAEIASALAGYEVAPEFILLAMLSVKLARYMLNPTNFDNIVDGSNYWAMLQHMKTHGEP